MRDLISVALIMLAGIMLGAAFVIIVYDAYHCAYRTEAKVKSEILGHTRRIEI